jgi:hypothetical protein
MIPLLLRAVLFYCLPACNRTRQRDGLRPPPYLNAAALVLVDWLVDKGVLAAGDFALGTCYTGSAYIGFVRATIQVREEQ